METWVGAQWVCVWVPAVGARLTVPTCTPAAQGSATPPTAAISGPPLSPCRGRRKHAKQKNAVSGRRAAINDDGWRRRKHAM